MSKRRKRKRRPAAQGSASAAHGGRAPVGRIETVQYRDFIEERKRHGAQEADTATMLEEGMFATTSDLGVLAPDDETFTS